MTRSKYEFYQEATLSQKLAALHPEYQEYAGSDPKISLSLAVFNVLEKFKMIDPKDQTIQLVRALLNEQRKARFATSEKVNEITKLGLMLPRGEEIIDAKTE